MLGGAKISLWSIELLGSKYTPILSLGNLSVSFQTIVTECITSFLKAYSKQSKLGRMAWTVLHHACEHLDSKCIFERCKTSTNELLEVDDHGSTPLHILAWGNPDIHLLQALVDCCPAALSDRNIHGDTCLHIACSFAGTDVKVVKLFLDACPGLVSTKNKEGLMPLHVACRFAPGNEAIIGFLINEYPTALLKPIKVNPFDSNCFFYIIDTYNFTFVHYTYICPFD